MYSNCLPLENISSSETPTQNENRSPAKQNLTTESIVVNNTRKMVELVEIKEEPDIKLEPEDEVDTIEYEQPLNQLAHICIPKVEKIEPNDNEADDARAAFHRSGLINFNSRNKNARFGTDLVDNEQPCSSHIGTHPNETSDVTMSREGRAVVATKPLTAAKSGGKSIKNIGKTSIRQSTSLAQKKQHKCSDCDYYTTKLYNLKQHMRTHSAEKPFPCASCDKRFAQKSVLQKHMKVHVNKESIHCSGCLKIFATEEEKLNHQLMCKRRSYECFLCRAYSTSNISHLKVHMRIHSGVRPFQCAQCSMNFTQKNNLEKHLDTHNRRPKFRCSVCTLNFSKQSEKDTHEVKCNRRRHECYLCQSYTTPYKPNLQLHMRMYHTGDKSFKCNLCANCYAMESDLKRHIKSSHKQ